MNGFQNNALTEQSIPQEIKEKFGEVLFGSIRGGMERDTSYEAYVFRKVFSYFSGEGMTRALSAEIEDVFQELLSIKGYYPDVLKPGVRGFIFRGIALNDPKTIDKFRSMGFLTPNNYKEIGNGKAVAKNLQYYPRHFIESWTDDVFFAKYMASTSSPVTLLDQEPRSTEAYLIIETKQYDPSELLFSTEFTNLLDREMGKKYEESEIVRLSKNPVSVDSIIRVPTVGSPMDDILGWHS